MLYCLSNNDALNRCTIAWLSVQRLYTYSWVRECWVYFVVVIVQYLFPKDLFVCACEYVHTSAGAYDGQRLYIPLELEWAVVSERQGLIIDPCPDWRTPGHHSRLFFSICASGHWMRDYYCQTPRRKCSVRWGTGRKEQLTVLAVGIYLGFCLLSSIERMMLHSLGFCETERWK